MQKTKRLNAFWCVRSQFSAYSKRTAFSDLRSLLFFCVKNAVFSHKCDPWLRHDTVDCHTILCVYSIRVVLCEDPEEQPQGYMLCISVCFWHSWPSKFLLLHLMLKSLYYYCILLSSTWSKWTFLSWWSPSDNRTGWLDVKDYQLTSFHDETHFFLFFFQSKAPF